MGGNTRSGVEITAKYIGNRRLIETAVATLANDRALLILGVPGTAKPWVSEHVVVLPLPLDLEEEVRIVSKRVGEIGSGLELPKIAPAEQEIMRIVTIFRELRDGQTLDGRLKLKSPSGSLSTAEAIAVTIGAWAEAGHFGSGEIDAQSMAANLVGAVVKDPVQDKVVLQEYLETVVRERKPWADLYGAIREVM
jgi:hypothetical protein